MVIKTSVFCCARRIRIMMTAVKSGTMSPAAGTSFFWEYVVANKVYALPILIRLSANGMDNTEDEPYGSLANATRSMPQTRIPSPPSATSSR